MGISLDSQETYIKEFLKKTPKSKKVYASVSKLFPGAVNSAIQFFSPYPVFMVKGYGSRLWDVDGNEYIDYCMAYGAMTAGHRNPAIIRRIVETAENYGTLLGAPTIMPAKLAKEIFARIPEVEMMRFTNSGCEATMYALRLARAVTKREKVVKVEGAYHGAHDYLLISDKPHDISALGPYEDPTPLPDSLGTPREVAKLTLTVHFNDVHSMEKVFRHHGNEIAAVIMEAVQTNMGVIEPRDNYLKEVRRICDEYGSLLIIDEVKTGFNAAKAAAYTEYGIKPDLVTLGKVIGGGTPLAAFGGKREFMEQITPVGKVVHYGTYNANPLSVAAGYAALTEVFTENTHYRMRSLNQRLFKGVNDALQDTGIKAATVMKGNMGAIFFGLEKPPKNFREAFQVNKKMWYTYWISMINKGVIPYGGAWFEEWFISAMHTKEDIDRTIEIYYDVMKEIRAFLS